MKERFNNLTQFSKKLDDYYYCFIIVNGVININASYAFVVVVCGLNMFSFVIFIKIAGDLLYKITFLMFVFRF